jgi:DNA-directed RNA polymerase subunit F
MREIANERAISIPQVKEILDRIIKAENIDMAPPAAIEPQPAGTEEGTAPPVPAVEVDKTKKYFLKSTYDYVQIFSKMTAKVATTMMEKLVVEDQLPLGIAIQIVNVNPDSVEELGLLLEKGQKRYSIDDVEKLLFKIRAYKELP